MYSPLFELQIFIWGMLAKNLGCLLLGVEPKDTTEPKIRRGEYIIAVRRMLEIFPKAVSPQTAKWGKLKAKETCISEELEPVDRVQALVDCSQED